MLPPSTSLVKYENPVLVSTTNEKGQSGQKKSKQLPPVEKKTSQTEDLLHSILPPREWTEDGQLWVQHVSSTPATRADVIHLQEQLDLRLQHQQARETGICPIREELYSQAFDELIRQVTINCAERGLLLLKMRDEARMTLQSYEGLYESSVAFGMRVTLMAQQSEHDVQVQLKHLDGDIASLGRQEAELNKALEALEQRETERFEEEEKKHQAEVEALRAHSDGLKKSLEELLSTS